ncbi:hypothetical protein PS910_04366 [Pseudomonas fluorescens]|nr:hypothetical protein PS910_04366 [Pseudomonas fluorescens]
MAVRQGHDHRRPGNRCFNRGGIHDGPTLGDAGRGGEGDSRGVGDIGDRGADRSWTGGQVFIVPAADPSDAVSDWRIALVDVVRCGVVDGTRALAHRNSDGLTIRQADQDRRAGNRSTHRRGVHDGPALRDARRGGQGNGRSVDHVGDRRADRSRAGDQVLVVAAADPGDAVGDWRIALVDVIRCGEVDRPRALADSDGDGLAIRQADHNRRAGDGSRYRGGIYDRAALGDAWRCGQGDGRGVGDISNRRADRRRAGSQIFIVAATDSGDAVGDRCVALIRIVWRGVVNRARALAHRNSDGLTIRQADHDRRAGDRSTHRRGVHDGPAFGHAWRGGEDDGRRVGHIGDRGADRSRAGGQVLVVAPSHTGDAVGDWSIALVGIVGCGVVDRPQALADRNGNRLPVGQADNNRSTSNWRIYRSGVNDRTALGHAWGSSEGHGRSIGHIGDRSADRSRAGGQVFIVAATDAGDAVDNWRIVLIGIVRRGVVD